MKACCVRPTESQAAGTLSRRRWFHRAHYDRGAVLSIWNRNQLISWLILAIKNRRLWSHKRSGRGDIKNAKMTLCVTKSIKKMTEGLNSFYINHQCRREIFLFLSTRRVSPLPLLPFRVHIRWERAYLKSEIPHYVFETWYLSVMI